MDDKKPISVKAPVKPTTSSVKQPSKRIDLGAASNYGKSTNLGINSPTHRNTHSEDLFVAEESEVKTIKSNSDIENIFENDDFNPRAGEPAQTVASSDFGDFESAFGGNNTAAAAAALPPVIIPSTSKQQAQNADFADFSSAFTTLTAVANASQSHDDNHFLFNTPLAAAAPSKSSGENIAADLFGNNVITSAFVSQSRNDLLDDFADLKINTHQGEFKKTK